MVRDMITNIDDVIDSRDIIDRIETLESERDEYNEEAPGIDEDGLTSWERAQPDDAEELKTLKSLAEQAEGCADWEHGETLIRDSYFEEYTRALLIDCGHIPKDFPSWIEIDWEATADNVKVDYTSVDYDGVTYWLRS